MNIDGKKTYLVSAAMVIYGLVGMALGWIEPGEGTRLIMEGAGIMGLRHGIQKATG